MTQSLKHLELVPGRDETVVPNMTFDETTPLADVSRFFRNLLLANRDRINTPMLFHRNATEAGPFSGGNRVVARTAELFLPRNTIKNWAFVRYQFDDNRRSPFGGLAETHRIQTEPTHAGSMANYITFIHTVGEHHPSAPKDNFDRIFIDHQDGTVGFTIGGGVEAEVAPTQEDVSARLVLARVMNECVEFLQA